MEHSKIDKPSRRGFNSFADSFHDSNELEKDKQAALTPPANPVQLKPDLAFSQSEKGESQEDNSFVSMQKAFSLPGDNGDVKNNNSIPTPYSLSQSPATAPVIQRTINNKYDSGSGKSASDINLKIKKYNSISDKITSAQGDQNTSTDDLKLNQILELESLRKMVSSNLKEKTKDAKPGKLTGWARSSASKQESAQKSNELQALDAEINDELRAVGGQLFSSSTIAKLGSMDDKKKKEVGRSMKHLYKKLYLKKGQTGRLMSELEINQLQEIKQNQGLGQEFLDNEMKTGTFEDALSYINSKNYKNWLQIHPNKRMVITSMIYHKVKSGGFPGISLSMDELKITPAYAMALSLAGNLQEIREHTAGNWEKTMASDSKLTDSAKQELNPTNDPEQAKKLQEYETKNDNAIKILKRVFLLLHAGLKENTKDNGYQDWTEKVSTALSHGGRVNIKIPKIEKGGDPNELLNWLGILENGKKNEKAGVVKRSFGTHHMEIDDKKGKFKEKGGKGAALKNKFGSTKIFGLDLAIGGFGNVDFNGDYILPDGANGHMFIGFKPPTKKNSGALEIGIETTGPGAHSNVGYVHNWNSTEATANPLSSAGGAKADKHGHGKLDWGRIDLNDLQIPFTENIQGWLAKLQELEVMYDEAKSEGRVNESHLVGEI